MSLNRKSSTLFHPVISLLSSLGLTLMTSALISGCSSTPVQPKVAAGEETLPDRVAQPAETTADAVRASAAHEKAPASSGLQSTVKSPMPTRSNRKPASHRWGNYRWARVTSPATLPIGDCLTQADWKKHLRAASSDWNQPKRFGAESTPLLNQPTACGQAGGCVPVAGTTQVCNAEYGENGWLGIATLYITGDDYITHGTAEVNDTYFRMATYNNPNQKLHVMCHEMAHTFGLGHQSEDGSSQNSCMDYFQNTGDNAKSRLSTRPHVSDFDELNVIYDRVDGFTTLASVDGKRPARITKVTRPVNSKAWGRLVHQSPNGRGSTYEATKKDGSKILTHVYWTVEASSNCPTCDHRDLRR